MGKLFSFGVKIFGQKIIFEVILSLMEYLAQKSSNKIDDKIVAVIKKEYKKLY